jgi:predicted NodU family carbamoyl transferase
MFTKPFEPPDSTSLAVNGKQTKEANDFMKSMPTPAIIGGPPDSRIPILACEGVGLEVAKRNLYDSILNNVIWWHKFEGEEYINIEDSKYDDNRAQWKYNYKESSQLYCNYAIDENGIGATYSAVTHQIGFTNYFEEGKTMGLASYKPSDVDNSEWSNKIEIASNLQKWSQERVLDLIKHAIEISGNKNVCLSGGYGLNCVANYYFRKNLPSDINLYCEPIANDAGQAMGLAQKLYHKVTSDTAVRPQKSIYYGPTPNY